MNFTGGFREKINIALLFLLIFSMYLFFLPKTGHSGDMGCWKDWSVFIFNEGLSKVYFSGTDYLPIYHYVLWLFGAFQRSPEFIQENIYYLKIITLIFDFVICYYLFRFLFEKYHDYYKSTLFSLVYILNISFLYNTLIWGQVDSIMTCFVFLAFYYAYKKRILTALIFYVLALNFKLQCIIFLPIIGLMLLPSIKQKFCFKNILIWAFAIIILQVLILSPSIYSGSVAKVWNVVCNSFGKYPTVSLNAFNFWYLVAEKPPIEINDTEIFIGLTYNRTGLLIFLTTSFFALLPLLTSVYKSIVGKKNLEMPIEKLLLTGAIVSLLFFYFNTQMHERYSHPAYIFITTYALLKNKGYLIIIASAAYFLNLEGALGFLHLKNNETGIFSPVFVSVLFLITIVLLFIDLYFEQKVNTKLVNKSK